MKQLGLTMMLGFAMLAPVAMATPNNQNGCGPSGGQPQKCDDSTPMPEPGIAILVSAGLLAVGGFALARRKQRSN